MATYKKPSVAGAVYTLMNGVYTIDGAAYGAFKAHKTAEVKSGDNTVLVPFHAVKALTKAVASEDVEKADPYCE